MEESIPKNTTTPESTILPEGTDQIPLSENAEQLVENQGENIEFEDVNIFSISRPKDALDGAYKGVGNMLKGALGGVAMILSAPVKGAMDGHASGGAVGAMKGFGIGLGAGLFGGTALALGGALTGAMQIGRGLVNTPNAISSSMSGKDWDDETKEWVEYNLAQDEKSGILTMSDEDFMKTLVGEVPVVPGGASPEASMRPQRQVADREYYDLLGIEPNATNSEVKKAYYVKARESHPDRNPDPLAHSKFQKIGEAYQVLSDEKLRANYDEGGKTNVEDAPKLDSSTLFAMIFGSEKFEPLVGELKLASQMSEQTAGEYEHPKLRAFKQRKRIVQCAINLSKKLDEFVSHCREEMNNPIFINQAVIELRNTYADEAKELAASPLGGTLLATIGDIYNEMGRSELDSLDSISMGLKKTGRSMATRYSIASSGVKAAWSANEVGKMQKRRQSTKSSQQQPDAESIGSTKGSGEKVNSSAEGIDLEDESNIPEDMKSKIKELSGHMFSLMWNVTRLDIESTLVKVCKRVLRDRSVNEETLNMRTKALIILGEEFIRHGVSSDKGLDDLIQKMSAGMDGKEFPSSTKDGPENEEKQQEQQPSFDQMSIKQLKEKVKTLGLENKTTGFTEKSEFVELLKLHFAAAASSSSSSSSSSTENFFSPSFNQQENTANKQASNFTPPQPPSPSSPRPKSEENLDKIEIPISIPDCFEDKTNVTDID